jgi:hypothetical protein
MAASMPTMAKDVVRVPSKYVDIVICSGVRNRSHTTHRNGAAPDASLGATLHGNNRPHTFVHPKIPQHVVWFAEGR